mmetsp:Transcript_15805/g.25295  ORF Transcript_15805/g.25295 Transcript_15805/m.25295 type:complete len:235 (-) Transcript_15805:415-1119(-)
MDSLSLLLLPSLLLFILLLWSPSTPLFPTSTIVPSCSSSSSPPSPCEEGRDSSGSLETDCWLAGRTTAESWPASALLLMRLFTLFSVALDCCVDVISSSNEVDIDMSPPPSVVVGLDKLLLLDMSSLPSLASCCERQKVRSECSLIIVSSLSLSLSDSSRALFLSCKSCLILCDILTILLSLCVLDFSHDASCFFRLFTSACNSLTLTWVSFLSRSMISPCSWYFLRSSSYSDS